MRERRLTLEIAEVRCSIVFTDGSFHDEFDAMFSNYRRWGFCTDGAPDITITVKKGDAPPPDRLTGNLFYHAMQYETVHVSLVFNLERSQGVIGFTASRYDSSAQLRIVEMIETFVSTAYLFYFFRRGMGTFIHSCGISDEGVGYIFAGPSGNGKSTIGRLSKPRTVLCDDLVVLRKDGNGRRKIFGTPFSGDLPSVNKGADCAALFFIEQSAVAEVVPMTRMAAVIELMKEGVIGNFLSLPEIERVYPYSGFFSLLIDLLEGIPCYRLKFKKDDSFWEVIRGQHQQTAAKA